MPRGSLIPSTWVCSLSRLYLHLCDLGHVALAITMLQDCSTKLS